MKMIALSRSLYRTGWLALFHTGWALACSCSPEAYAPACHKISNAQIVFAGTVRQIEPDPRTPEATKFRVYHFRVDMPYKGLQEGTNEVIVNPDNFSSCQREYKAGLRYLVFGSKEPGTDEVLSGGCHGFRLVEYAADDMRFLEAYRKKQASSIVYGRVLQWVTGIGPPSVEADAPVANATITLRNETKLFTQQSNRDGEYRFEAIPAGIYTLTARREPYSKSCVCTTRCPGPRMCRSLPETWGTRPDFGYADHRSRHSRKEHANGIFAQE